MKSYQELKAKHAKEFNDFEGIFFAFSDGQFAEGMKKVGLSPDDTGKIYSLGAGGFILKDKSKAFSEMIDRQDKERKEQRKDAKILLESLVYELNNHEYCITGDLRPALEALGLDKKDIDPAILQKAIKETQSEDRIN